MCARCVLVCTPTLTRPPRSQCYLRLIPHVRCDTAQYRGVLALSVMTLLVFVAGFPLACSLLLWRGAGHWAEASLRFLQQSVRATWWRSLWVGPVRFGKNLLIAALIGASDFSQTSLPFLVFCALLVLLLMQACRSRAPCP